MSHLSTPLLGNLTVTVSNPFIQAAFKGDLEKVRKHFRAESLDQIGKDGFNALYAAVAKAHIHVVMFLVEKGADLSNGADRGFTPLHIAVICPDRAVFSYLVHVHTLKKVSVDLCSEERQTPLSFAARFSRVSVMRILIEAGADPNALDLNDRLPLHLAGFMGMARNIEFLVNHHGGDVNSVDAYGYTTLHWAAYSGEMEAVQYLVEHCGADLSATTVNEETAAEVAQANNKQRAHKYLCQKMGQ